MLSRVVNIARNSNLHHSINRKFSQTINHAGALYTWGSYPLSLGLAKPNFQLKTEVPNKVEGLDSVVKVSMGPRHTGVITQNGELYTFGEGCDNVLGHNDRGSTHYHPALVKHFSKSSLTVKDVACGGRHTLALASDGAVYSWGWGGQTYNIFSRLLNPTAGALGHGYTSNKPSPTVVEALRNISVNQISCSENHSFAIAGSQFFFDFVYDFLGFLGNGQVYNWGIGLHNVFGQESILDISSPTISESLLRLKEKRNLHATKVKTAGYATLALMTFVAKKICIDDGTLYGWGLNHEGQLGQFKEVGINLDPHVETPKKVDDKHFKGKKVTDFDIGENIAIFVLETGQVFWMGLSLVYTPVELKLPAGKKVKKVAAAKDAVCVLTHDNHVYMKGHFMKASDYLHDLDIGVGDTSFINNGEILDIGGSFGNRYMIVKSQIQLKHDYYSTKYTQQRGLNKQKMQC